MKETRQANAEEVGAMFFKHLATEEELPKKWLGNRAWTPVVTSALAEVGKQVFSHKNLEVAHIKNRDSEDYSEYLTIDVMVWDQDEPWGPPLMVAETESKKGKDWVKYAAWKLLVVETQLRVLAAYFGTHAEFETYADLRDAVQEVCNANPGRPLILLAANTGDATSAEEVKGHYEEPITLIGPA